MRKQLRRKQLKQLRKLRGYTQQELGDRCEINQCLIQSYESGRRNPKDENLQKLANALEVNLWALKDINIDMNDSEAIRQLFFQLEEKGILHSEEFQLQYQQELGDEQYFLRIPIEPEMADFLSQWKLAREGALKNVNGEAIGYEEWKYAKTLQKK